MSLFRITKATTTTCVARPRITQTNRRASTSSAHDEHHFEDSTVYPKEVMGKTTWRNTILVALTAVGFYQFAPTPGEEASVTRFLKKISHSREALLEQNMKHALQSKDSADDVLLLTDAKRERVHRYRYPQNLDFVSPHLARVGQTADMSNVAVKN